MCTQHALAPKRRSVLLDLISLSSCATPNYTSAKYCTTQMPSVCHGLLSLSEGSSPRWREEASITPAGARSSAPRGPRAMRRSHSVCGALALLFVSVGPTFANIVIDGNGLTSLRGLASPPKEAHRQDLQSVSSVDCAALVLPVDISPIRSPLAVHTALARRFAGRDIVEIGTRAGDAISCFARVARTAIAVEVVPKYCQALRARASRPGKAASFRIICDDYRNASLDADMITWWQQVQAVYRICDVDVACCRLKRNPK